MHELTKCTCVKIMACSCSCFVVGFRKKKMEKITVWPISMYTSSDVSGLVFAGYRITRGRFKRLENAAFWRLQALCLNAWLGLFGSSLHRVYQLSDTHEVLT